MKKLAYLDCPTGIAGDMCLGALVHAGVPLTYLIETLERLGMGDEYELQAEAVRRNGQAAIKIHVHLLAVRTESDAPDLAAPIMNPASAVKVSPPAPRHDHSDRHFGVTADSKSALASAHPLTQPAELPASAPPHRPTRHLPEIEHLILEANLPAKATAWSLAVFRRLAEAEGAVHGIPPEQVHFHEVGAADAIVDIVGTCLGLDWLDIDQLYCSALPIGGGIIQAAHGQLPVPAPAVLKLFELGQVPIYSNGIQRELVTPTGAAIATALAAKFGSPPAMRLQQVGLGAGGRQLPLPNILRLWIGEGEGEGGGGPGGIGEAGGKRSQKSEGKGDKEIQNPPPTPHPPPHSPSPLIEEPIMVLQTQVDDLNPQAIGYLFDRLFEAGAVDVFTQTVGMKKSRPGFLLTVLCHPAQADRCETVLFRETTTLGVRRSSQRRHILHREIQTVQTPYGEVRIKIAQPGQQGPILNVQPEYEDCAALAHQNHLPWREVHWAALQVWRQNSNDWAESTERFSPANPSMET